MTLLIALLVHRSNVQLRREPFCNQHRVKELLDRKDHDSHRRNTVNDLHDVKDEPNALQYIGAYLMDGFLCHSTFPGLKLIFLRLASLVLDVHSYMWVNLILNLYAYKDGLMVDEKSFDFLLFELVLGWFLLTRLIVIREGVNE